MLKINNVEVVRTDNEEGKWNYTFFACSCKDEDEDFYDKLFKDYTVTSLIYGLLSEGWWVTCIAADMWMGISLEHEDGYSMYIQCDSVEHGLAVALQIAENI